MAIKFDPKKALLIILGASSWPNHGKYKEFSHGDQSLQVSADKVEKYFLEKVVLSTGRILNLFNKKENAVVDQLRKIEEFLKENEPTKDGDLFVYFAGHGEFENDDYFLLINQSTEDVQQTAISMTSLVGNRGRLLDNARYKRWYFIIDACQSGVLRKIMPEVGEMCREPSSDVEKRGIVLFCASSEFDSAKKNTDTFKPTLFTGSLLEVLNKGMENDQSHLSYNEVNALLNKYLEEGNKQIPEPQYYVIGKYQRIVGNLKIFPNATYRPVGTVIESSPYSMEDIEELPQIKWHITTSNKGGVGKTLLSMMLLTHYSKEIRQGNEHLEIPCPLVIDLNGVNTDLKRLLVADHLLEKHKNKSQYVELRNEKILIVKVNQEQHPFFLGWMNDDPFKMLNTSSFFNLLMAIKGEGIKKIKNTFGENFSIDTVIIDTNYHFCNIFSDNDADYKNRGLKDFLWDRDLFFIWFIWVYGQIRNFSRSEISGISSVSDIHRMQKVSACVEKYLTSSNKKVKESPFFHVINPMGLTTKEIKNKEAETEKQNLISRWFSFGHPKKSEDKSLQEKFLPPPLKEGQPIPELETLIGGGGDATVRFALMQILMKSAWPSSQEINKLEVHERDRIKSMLGKLKIIFEEKHGRPRNFVPISVYQELLESYQDREHISLQDLEGLGIYLKFKGKEILGKI